MMLDTQEPLSGGDAGRFLVNFVEDETKVGGYETALSLVFTKYQVAGSLATIIDSRGTDVLVPPTETSETVEGDGKEVAMLALAHAGDGLLIACIEPDKKDILRVVIRDWKNVSYKDSSSKPRNSGSRRARSAELSKGAVLFPYNPERDEIIDRGGSIIRPHDSSKEAQNKLISLGPKTLLELDDGTVVRAEDRCAELMAQEKPDAKTYVKVLKDLTRILLKAEVLKPNNEDTQVAEDWVRACVEFPAIESGTI